MSRVYEVEAILDEAVINNQPHYLIKWQNYPHEFDTWEPISSLGSILDYLKYWLRKRSEKMKSKERENKKEEAFQVIKPYLYRENLLPKRKTRQQYADEILKKKKTWERYIENDQRYIDIDGEADQRLTGITHNSNLQATMEANGQKPRKLRNIRQHICKRQQQSSEEEPHYQPQASQKFKVIGTIDTTQISKILKLFTWNGVRCAQVEHITGKRFNMRQQELKEYQPLLLMDFYQSENLPI